MIAAMPRFAFVLLLSLLACMPAQANEVAEETLHLDAPGVSTAPIRVRVYLPPDYAVTQARYEVLYVNDGQDMEAVGMAQALERLYARHAITRLIVVAIDMPSDRIAGYGLFDRARDAPVVAPTKYGAVGANARIYATWLIQRLLPAIDARYRTRTDAAGRAILGWSLGAASAFGIGWQHPELFGRVGAFSPSFWLAADNRDAAAVQSTRIAHRLVDTGAPGARPLLFLGVGTREETDDRDGDGVVDVLDDARDLLERVTRARTGTQFLQPGDGIGTESSSESVRGDAVLFLLPGGAHDQRSWARMLPVFLTWAYSPVQ